MTTTPSRTARLMTTADLAELLGVDESTVRRWRKSGDGPPYLMTGRVIRYHPARVQQWLATCEQGTPSPSRGTPSSREGTPSRKGAPSPRRGTPSSKGTPRAR